jgi:putative endonuclease
MLFFVYILYSKSLDKYYIGSTENLTRRLEEHNRGKGNFTSKGVPWLLAYKEEYTNKTNAVKRELAIKKRKSRLYVQHRIDAQRSEYPVL